MCIICVEKKNEVFVRKFAGYSFRGSSLRIPVRKKKIFLARRRMSVDMTVLRPFAREQPFSVWTEAWWALCSVDPRRVEVIDKPRGGSLKVSNGACDTSQPKQQKSKQQKFLKICEYTAAVDHGQVKVWHFRVKFMKCLWIFIMWWIFVICASLFADMHYHCVSVGVKGRLRLTHFFLFCFVFWGRFWVYRIAFHLRSFEYERCPQRRARTIQGSHLCSRGISYSRVS